MCKSASLLGALTVFALTILWWGVLLLLILVVKLLHAYIINILTRLQVDKGFQMSFNADDIVFFFGAGASAPFGIPTMKQFVIDFENYLDEKGKSDERKAYRNIKNILETKLNREIDLEDVFTVIDGIINLTPERLGVLPIYVYSPSQMPTISHYPNNYIDTCESLEKKFQSFVREKCRISDEKFYHKIAIVYQDFFNRLWHESSQRSSTIYRQNQNYFYCKNWAIFTTNYDTCLESYWRECVGPDDGLNTGFRLDESRNRWILSPERLFSIDRVRLMKLHGSISWQIGQDEKTVTEEQTLGYSLIGRRYIGQMMIYPIQQKELYLEPYITMFKILNSELRNKSVWIIIGYSFNDPIIREIFIQNSDDKKRIIYVHPDAAHILGEKIGDIKGRFSALNQKFGENDFKDVNNSIVKQIKPNPTHSALDWAT